MDQRERRRKDRKGREHVGRLMRYLLRRGKRLGVDRAHNKKTYPAGLLGICRSHQ